MIGLGLKAKKVTLDKDNFNAVMNYGQRLYSLGRLCDENGNDILDEEGEVYTFEFVCRDKNAPLSTSKTNQLRAMVEAGNTVNAWLIGCAVQEVKIRSNTSEAPIKLIGNDAYANKHTITVSDMYALYSYTLNVMEGVGDTDDIDMLGNRRIRSVGELIQNQFRIGLSRMERVVKERMSIAEIETLTPKKYSSFNSCD